VERASTLFYDEPADLIYWAGHPLYDFFLLEGDRNAMPTIGTQQLAPLLRAHEPEILTEWMSLQLQSIATRRDLINEAQLHRQSREFLAAFIKAVGERGADISGAEYAPVREILAEMSRTRAHQGFAPSETATFIFSLKQPVFNLMRRQIKDVESLAAETWAATVVLDALGLVTAETHLKTREEVIVRQQQEMLELSTPVVTLWNGVLALPLIGTLDSARTQVVMESLLQRIVDSGASIAILDITGVPTVDTLVAQHLLKTVAAARLMGADCIISGIRPQIAQTIVHLGVDLNSVVTKATLADAFAIALKRVGLAVTRTGEAKPQPAAPPSPAQA
jgi:rsbT co-antagonist protein RsbR